MKRENAELGRANAMADSSGQRNGLCRRWPSHLRGWLAAGLWSVVALLKRKVGQPS